MRPLNKKGLVGPKSHVCVCACFTCCRPRFEPQDPYGLKPSRTDP